MSTSSVFVSILSNQFLHLALNWSMVCFFLSIILILPNSLAWDMRWISREFAAAAEWDDVSWAKNRIFSDSYLVRFLLRISVSSNHWLLQHFLCDRIEPKLCHSAHSVPYTQSSALAHASDIQIHLKQHRFRPVCGIFEFHSISLVNNYTDAICL